MLSSLQQSWTQLCSSFVTDEALINELWKELEVHYSHKNRHYHGFQHLHDLLSQANEFKSEIADFETLQFSIFYHDIIYKASRSDNEYQSALVAQNRLKQLGLTEKCIQRCDQQIMLTKSHQWEAAPLDDQYFIDFDLSILGRPWERYQEYAQQVRKEFKIYPNFLYRKGRKKALQSFLNRDRIYATPHYFKQYEENARTNLEREIKSL